MGGKKKTCEQLISQLMRYKTNVTPYNMLYDDEFGTPLMWWLTCEDRYNHLQRIAIKIFSVIPHSAGCERVFSHLGWMYGKTRQRLDLKRLEDMSKIHSFYFSNCKKEFNYFGQNLPEDEVKKSLIESAQLCLEEIENDEEVLPEIDDDYEVLDNLNNNLDIEDIMNLNEIALEIKNDSDLDNSSVESEIQEEESTDYDLQELVESMLNNENDYENDYENDNKNDNESDNESSKHTDNSLDIEKDNSDSSNNNQVTKVVEDSKKHNLRQRKHKQNEK
jgi:hypothetical protein